MPFEDICALGGAECPFEIIYSYVGGVMPGGRVEDDGTPDAKEILWRQMRAWMAISLFWKIAFLQYNREL